MARLVQYLFNTNDDANDGKIRVTMQNTDASPGTPYKFYIGITSPSGEVIADITTVAANIDGGADTSVSVNYDIPLDADGNYLGGTYTLVTRRDNEDGDNTTVTDTYLYTPNNAPDHLTGDIELTTSFKCLDGAIVATDTTDYDTVGVLIDDRTITITPPSVDPQAAVNTDAASTTLTVAFTNVTYMVSLDVTFYTNLTDLGDDVSVSKQGSCLIYKEILVECETGGICGSIGCVADQMNEVYEKACAAGGYARLSQSTKDNISWAMMNLAMAKFQYDCGNVATSGTYLARATEAINCGCGCSGTTTATPAPYTPPTEL